MKRTKKDNEYTNLNDFHRQLLVEYRDALEKCRDEVFRGDDNEYDEVDGYDPDSFQERWLREYKRKRERKNKILKLFGLGPKPMKVDCWDEDEHCWIVNKWLMGWEKFKENPVIPVTIIFGTAVLIYTFFFE